MIDWLVILDVLNLGMRLIILFLTGVISQLTFQKKFYSLTIFLFGVWTTIFYLTLLRAISMYAGVFRNLDGDFLLHFKYFLMDSYFTNIPTFIILIGSILLFFWIKDCYKNSRHPKKYYKNK